MSLHNRIESSSNYCAARLSEKSNLLQQLGHEICFNKTLFLEDLILYIWYTTKRYEGNIPSRLLCANVWLTVEQVTPYNYKIVVLKQILHLNNAHVVLYRGWMSFYKHNKQCHMCSVCLLHNLRPSLFTDPNPTRHVTVGWVEVAVPDTHALNAPAVHICLNKTCHPKGSIPPRKLPKGFLSWQSRSHLRVTVNEHSTLGQLRFGSWCGEKRMCSVANESSVGEDHMNC